MESAMKKIILMRFAIVLIGVMANSTAWAHGGGHGGFDGGGHFGGGGHYGGGGWGYGRGMYYGGVGLGLGYGLNYYGAYPYYNYNYPPVITIPVAPPVYVQQAAPAPVVQQYPAGYWYHCSNPEGYYPYIKACPNGWQQVEPTPLVPR
jgi:hypothetical protein